jgi:hypothetical protein
MGSSSSRKKSDSPIIQVPKGGKAGSGSGGSAKSEQIATMCLPSFEVRLKENMSVKVGSVVQLEIDAAGLYQIYSNRTIIGTLSKKQSDMISACKDLGAVYDGKIVSNKDKELYARFYRK